MATAIAPAPAADLEALKARQQAAWSAGNYAMVGSTIQIVGETLCEAVDLRGGQRVLDVAAGNGNASLAAARRWCEVVSTDYVPALLDNGRERAAADGLSIEFRVADAEALPFEDGAFDAVLSTFGVMFTADHDRAAAELLRVCRSGGKIGLANWTPDGFIGEMFQTLGRHVPPLPAARSPALWGTPARLAEMFGADTTIDVEVRQLVFRLRSPAHYVEVLRTYYGPVLKAFAALDADAQGALEFDLLALIDRYNRTGDGTLVVPSDYLEVVMVKR